MNINNSPLPLSLSTVEYLNVVSFEFSKPSISCDATQCQLTGSLHDAYAINPLDISTYLYAADYVSLRFIFN
jgi:hypothetical protein